MIPVYTPHSCAAQGDIYVRRVDRRPQDARPVARAAGRPIVVTHSETGHDHICEDVGAELFDLDALTGYLEVTAEHCDIVHTRPHDTHPTLRLGRGTWEIRRQREYVPEGWRRVED